MKRELASLEAGSLVLDSIGRKTRSSKHLPCTDSNGFSESFVRKRVKRSVQVRVIQDVKDDGVGSLNVIHHMLNEVENTLIVEENGIDNNSLIVENDLGESKKLQLEDNEVKTSMEDNGDLRNLRVIVNALEANVASVKVNKNIVMEGSLLKSPSTIVDGNVKNSSVERHTRRFTRSALKSEAEIKVVVTDSVVQNDGNLNGVLNKHSAEVGVKGTSSRTKLSEKNGKLENLSADKHPKRVTRSSLKSKVDGMDLGLIETSCSTIPDKENTEPVTSDVNMEPEMNKDVEESIPTTPNRKLEMKMSKQIALANIPTSVRELLETGLLEGCPVYYKGGKAPMLRGRIRGLGILCSCDLCKGCKVVSPSLFEIHARKSYKKAVEHIFLENGRSFFQILRACKSTRLDTLEATLQNAIGPLGEKKWIDCQNCKEPFSTLDAESSEPVCSSCVMSNLSPTGPVYSSRELCRSGFKLCNFPRMNNRSLDAYLTPKLRSSPRIGKPLEIKAAEQVARTSGEAFLVPETYSNSPMGKSSETKSCEKLMKKPFNAAFSPMLSGCTTNGKSSTENDSGKTAKRLRKEVVTPKASKSSLVRNSSEQKSTGKITRKDQRLHKLVFEEDVLPDGTELGYYVQGKKLLDGYKKGSGIYCNCCYTVVSASQFEAHAGCASRRKPYCYIYTSNGVSLHELSVSLMKERTHSTKYNDDLCSICADGGDLLLCDGCPRAFHMECASLSRVPHGKWYCKYCENMFERENFVAYNANAVAAGRVSGVDPIEQITTRSIRIVSNLGSEASSCILCRGFDFCKSGFGPRTIIICDQCEKEYHVGCLKDHKMADLKELPDGKWFCNVDCGRIETALQNLLGREAEKLPESLMDIIRKKHTQKDSECATDFDVSWRLLSGKIASSETRPLLSQAVAIFHESFAPIMDVVSGHDLIPAMVYGRNVGGQDYGGMYCAVLMINSVVVSAGIFRVFGLEVAELPLVATSSGNHGKGYFQALFACIERLLAFLKVKSFVLPAAEEAKSIWTDRFGFTKMTPDQLCELRRNYWSILRFQGTSMLHKSVPHCRVIQSQAD